MIRPPSSRNTTPSVSSALPARGRRPRWWSRWQRRHNRRDWRCRWDHSSAQWTMWCTSSRGAGRTTGCGTAVTVQDDRRVRSGTMRRLRPTLTGAPPRRTPGSACRHTCNWRRTADASSVECLRIEEDVGAEPFPPLQWGSTEGALGDVDQRIGPRDIAIALTEQPVTRFAQRSIDDRPVIGVELAVYPPSPVLVLQEREVAARRTRPARPLRASSGCSRCSMRSRSAAEAVDARTARRSCDSVMTFAHSATSPSCSGRARTPGAPDRRTVRRPRTPRKVGVGRSGELDEGVGRGRRQAGAPGDPLLDRTNSPTVPRLGGDRLSDQPDQHRVASVEVTARRGDAVVERRTLALSRGFSGGARHHRPSTSEVNRTSVCIVHLFVTSVNPHVEGR